MVAAAEVGLQNLSKQIPFQQAVGHGQKLLDDLVEVLEETGDQRVIMYFFTLQLL